MIGCGVDVDLGDDRVVGLARQAAADARDAVAHVVGGLVDVAVEVELDRDARDLLARARARCSLDPSSVASCSSRTSVISVSMTFGLGAAVERGDRRRSAGRCRGTRAPAAGAEGDDPEEEDAPGSSPSRRPAAGWRGRRASFRAALRRPGGRRRRRVGPRPLRARSSASPWRRGRASGARRARRARRPRDPTRPRPGRPGACRASPARRSTVLSGADDVDEVRVALGEHGLLGHGERRGALGQRGAHLGRHARA